MAGTRRVTIAAAKVNQLKQSLTEVSFQVDKSFTCQQEKKIHSILDSITSPQICAF